MSRLAAPKANTAVRSIRSPGETRGSASVLTHIPGLHPGYEVAQ